MNKLLPLLLLLTACSNPTDVLDTTIPIEEIVVQPTPEPPVLPALAPEPDVPQMVEMLPAPVVEPIVQPIVIEPEPEPESIYMTPQNPFVLYTVEQKWESPSEFQLPVPSVVVHAEVQFNQLGTQPYTVIRDGSVVSSLTADDSDPYRFQFVQPELAESLDVNTFPEIQLMTDGQVSEIAPWVVQ